MEKKKKIDFPIYQVTLLLADRTGFAHCLPLSQCVCEMRCSEAFRRVYAATLMRKHAPSLSLSLSMHIERNVNVILCVEEKGVGGGK